MQEKIRIGRMEREGEKRTRQEREMREELKVITCPVHHARLSLDLLTI